MEKLRIAIELLEEYARVNRADLRIIAAIDKLKDIRIGEIEEAFSNNKGEAFSNEWKHIRRK